MSDGNSLRVICVSPDTVYGCFFSDAVGETGDSKKIHSVDQRALAVSGLHALPFAPGPWFVAAVDSSAVRVSGPHGTARDAVFTRGVRVQAASSPVFSVTRNVVLEIFLPRPFQFLICRHLTAGGVRERDSGGGETKTGLSGKKEAPPCSAGQCTLSVARRVTAQAFRWPPAAFLSEEGAAVLRWLPKFKSIKMRRFRSSVTAAAFHATA